jgi:hypothetical protein
VSEEGDMNREYPVPWYAETREGRGKAEKALHDAACPHHDKPLVWEADIEYECCGVYLDSGECCASVYGEARLVQVQGDLWPAHRVDGVLVECTA